MLRSRVFLLALLVVGGCRPASAPNPGFRDSSVQGSISVDDLVRLSVGDSRPEVKFIITFFDDAERRRLTLLDGHFYRMHDEWYWMRLLNGVDVPGSDERPLSGLDLRTVNEAYAWAKVHSPPFDLAWSEEGRLFSGDFYLSCLGKGRRFGIGSMLMVKSRQGADAPSWVFQLEYMDSPSREDLLVFFEVLERAMPKDVTSRLRWLTRSAEQEELVRQLQSARDPIAQRVLHLRDIVASDRVEVYSEGITAGRVRMFKVRPPAPGTTSSEDIVVLAAAPDELPAAAGLITATPQTPLAHVTLLAQNRGIPNAYVDQAFDDPAMATVMRDGTKAVLRAVAPNRLTLVPITDAQFATWAELRRPTPISGLHLDPSNIAYSYDLGRLVYADVSQLRPLIGGKAAGYLLLATQRHLPIAGPARVITTRAFDEHLAKLRPIIDRVMREPAFESDAKIRFLLLEGMERFNETHPSDRKTVPRFLAGQGKLGPLVQLVRSGGLTGAIRKASIAPGTAQRLREELSGQFGRSGPALRFRSSSTVEDIEGFNAAGLYESATGFVDQAAMPDRKDQSRSIEKAIKKVWASYWGFVAFEERRRERIDHHMGAMAILVHPRFDDQAELANGVITFTRLPNSAERMRVAVQVGATSVTNPSGRSQPELVTVEREAADTLAPQIKRQQASSIAQGAVLSDAQLTELFTAAELLIEAARGTANQGLRAEQQRRSYTLDIEFRLMAAKWLGAAARSDSPALVLKQARSLEPEPRGMASSLFDEPIARDLLTRARRIDSYRCHGKRLAIEFLSLFTDVKSVPDMGYRDKPYTAWVKLEGTGQGPQRWLNGDFLRLERPKPRGAGSWRLQAELNPEIVAQTHWQRLELELDRITLERDDGFMMSEVVECSRRILHDTADAYLLDLIEE